MEQRVSLITLGVADVHRAQAFYQRLGWEGQEIEETVFIQAGGIALVLWGRDKLALDCGVTDDQAPGFSGVVLAHNVRSETQVDDVIAAAQRAGATVTRPAAKTFYGGYAGVFTDLDGHAWEIAHNPGFPLADHTRRRRTGPAGNMLIREATGDDWLAIWPLLEHDIVAGETFCFDRDLTEDQARQTWFPQPPGRAVVAVDDQGAVVGIATIRPNHGGPAAHIANASFLVDPEHAGRGIGRALGAHVLDQARADGYRAMQFNAVVETNTRAVALWRSLGFDVLATVPEAFHHPVDGYVGLHIMYRRL